MRVIFICAVFFYGVFFVGSRFVLGVVLRRCVGKRFALRLRLVAVRFVAGNFYVKVVVVLRFILRGGFLNADFLRIIFHRVKAHVFVRVVCFLFLDIIGIVVLIVLVFVIFDDWLHWNFFHNAFCLAGNYNRFGGGLRLRRGNRSGRFLGLRLFLRNVCRRSVLVLNQFCLRFFLSRRFLLLLNALLLRWRLRFVFLFFLGLEFFRNLYARQLKVVKLMQIFLVNRGGFLRLQGGKLVFDHDGRILGFARNFFPAPGIFFNFVPGFFLFL